MGVYAPLTWVDNVTDLIATNMNHLEGGVAAAMPKSGGAADPITGTLYFGASADVNLYRSAPNTLKSDGRVVSALGFTVDANSTGYGGAFRSSEIAAGAAFANYLLLADANPAFAVNGDGKMLWGAGGASATDSNLYRIGVNRIGTDGMFTVGGSITVTPNIFVRNDTAHIYFGLSDDTYLFRASANVLQVSGTLLTGKTTVGFVTGGELGNTGYLRLTRSAVALSAFQIGVNADANSRLQIDSNGKIEWGPGGATAVDTSLYRSGVGTLTIPGSLIVAGSLSTSSSGVYYNPATATGYPLTSIKQGDANAWFSIRYDGYMSWGAGGASATDTGLYRSAAYTLRVSEVLEVNQNLNIGLLNNAFLGLKQNNATIYFGVSSDTTLYRSAAAQLKTDGGFTAGGPYYMTGSPGGQGGGVRYLGGAGGATSWYMNAATGGNIYLAIGETTVATVGTTVFQLSQPLNFLGDTNLYRYAANWLATSGRIWVGWGTAPGASDVALVASGDGWPRISMNNNGILYFGPGTAGTDTSLYRSAAGMLKTDGIFRVAQHLYVDDSNGGYKLFFGSASDTNLYRGAYGTVQTTGSIRANNYLDVDFGGTGAQLRFGSAVDTNLYRSAAGKLKTDSVLEVGGGSLLFSPYAGVADAAIRRIDATGLLRLENDLAVYRALWVASVDAVATTTNIGIGAMGAAGQAGLKIGSDTNLYRFAANFLGTTSDFVARQGNAGQISLQASGALPIIYFGSAQDTNLYRASALNLNTDGNFNVGYTVTVDRLNGGGRLYFGGAQDTNLYRFATNILKTDGNFYAGGQIVANIGVAQQIQLSPSGTITFGSAADTNLYRSAAGVLKTDGILNAVGGLQINGVAVGAGSGVVAGVIAMYGGATAPAGYVLCDGASYVRTGGTYDALFAAIGTAYGFVDGTHFNVPDLQGRIPVGKGTNAAVNVLNANDGQTVANRRPHHRTTNALSASQAGHNHGTGDGTNSVFQIANPGGTPASSTGAGPGNIAGGTIKSTTDTQTPAITMSGSIGTNVANDALDTPSYIVVNYIIKL